MKQLINYHCDNYVRDMQGSMKANNVSSVGW